MLDEFSNQNDKVRRSEFFFHQFLVYFMKQSKIQSTQNMIQTLKYPPKKRGILLQLSEDN